MVLGLLLAFVPLAVWGRSWAVRRALLQGTAALRQLDTLLPTAQHDEADEAQFFPFFRPFDQGDVSDPAQMPEEQELPSSPAPRGAAAQGSRRPPPVLPPPQSRVAPAELVLSWANLRLVPQGRSRPKEFGLPAGIELSGVALLGIGLLDGDRLIAVAGVPVSHRAEVVSNVLAARGRREQTIVARLARRTALGVQEFTISVEQPYPDTLGQEIGPK